MDNINLSDKIRKVVHEVVDIIADVITGDSDEKATTEAGGEGIPNCIATPSDESGKRPDSAKTN